VVIFGRYRGAAAPGAAIEVEGTSLGDPWKQAVALGQPAQASTWLAASWARAHLRDMEDRYAAGARELEPQIVRVSKQFGVLSRFTGPAKGLRPHTFATMFGLLAATGMRVGEALRLRIADYADGGLTIRNTKFLKNRWIPLHSSTCVALDAYLALRTRVASTTDHIFVSERRKPYRHRGAWEVFATLCRGLGIVRSDGPAHLHDLRHTFAVRALERCRGDRFSIREHMLALTTYLGHACVVSTYWYLHATPSLMSAIASTTERHFRRGLS
jgi:integrase